MITRNLLKNPRVERCAVPIDSESIVITTKVGWVPTDPLVCWTITPLGVDDVSVVGSGVTSTNHRLAIANDAPLFFSPDAPRVMADWVIVNITRGSPAVETPQTRTRAPGLKRDPRH